MTIDPGGAGVVKALNEIEEGSVLHPGTTIEQTENTHALAIVQTGTTSASTSTGGAVNINNSGNTGAGLVLYTTQASPSGRLLVARVNAPTFNQTAAYFENNGTGHALHANQTAGSTNTTGSAANFTSSNPGASCVQVSGVETGRGTVKVTHTGTGSDANASAVSLDLKGSGTACQGLHIDATDGGTTGALVDVRNAGHQLFKMSSDAATKAIPILTLGDGGPVITTCHGVPAVSHPNGSICIRDDPSGALTTIYARVGGSWVGIA